MKKILFVFLITHCSLLIIYAQTQFQRAIGGLNDDKAYSIIQTTDGGYAVAGQTALGAGVADFYIVKLDVTGTLQWSRTVGGTGIDFAYSIVQTTDGGYAVAGRTNSFGAGADDMYIVKLDAGGMLQWSRTVGTTSTDIAWSIIQTTDGGYIVAGYMGFYGAGAFDMYIIKLDNSGTLQWSRPVGGTSYDYGYSIIQTTDGGFAVAGYTQSFGAGFNDFYIVKLDSGGLPQWTRTVGGANNNDIAYSIIQTTDGGYAVAGETRFQVAGNRDYYIIKLDGSGTLQWSRTIGGTGDEVAYSIKQATDGGFALAGYTASFGAGLNDFYIVKLDGSGTLQWSKTIGGTGNDVAWSIILTADGGYALAGETGSFGTGGDMFIVKLDAGGNTCGNSNSPSGISGTGGTTTSPTSTVTSLTPTVTPPASTTGTGGTVTPICTLVGIQPVLNEIPQQFSLSQNYPNPFNPATKIKFAIPSVGNGRDRSVQIIFYDVLGREVETLVNEQLQPGTYEVNWDASNYPGGIYYYRLLTEEFSETKKAVLIK